MFSKIGLTYDENIFQERQGDYCLQDIPINKAKDIEKHLKAELSLLGATRMSSSAQKNLIKGIPPISKNELQNVFDTYQKDGGIKVGNVTVSARHLEKVSPDKLTDPALKKQVTEVIQTSINATEWQTELQKFFDKMLALLI